jgi:DNA polymerase-1
MQQGFFNLPAQATGPAGGRKRNRSQFLPPPRLDCDACGLYATGIKSPKMDPYGNGSLGILNVGEGPGEKEDLYGKQWQGPVGNLLRRKYQALGVDLFEDCWNVNAVNCRPTTAAKTKERKNRTPTPVEIACCREVKVKPAIEEFQPKVIMVIGYPALVSIVGPKWKGKDGLGPISRWTGFHIPDRDYGAWLCPVFHPSYVARSEQEVEVIWERDLEKALAMRDIPFPEDDDEESLVKVLLHEAEIEAALNKLLEQSSEVWFDIETTGLKPFNSVHDIISWSFASDAFDTVFSFLHPGDNPRLLRLIEKLLRTPRIGKIAWNMKFEDLWVKTKLKYEVRPWVYDPMQVVHTRDNRVGLCSLKFQTYVNFGLAGYDRAVPLSSSDINPDISYYREGCDPDNTNSENRFRDLIKTKEGIQFLLMYGGLDSVFQKKLTVNQRFKKVTELQQLVFDGTIAFADAEATGFRFAKEEAQEQYDILGKKIEHLQKRAETGQVYAKMRQLYGTKANMGSGDQLAEVLYNHMGYKPLQLTKSEKRGSVDEEALTRINLPEIRDILEVGKLEKIRETYLGGFIREVSEDGYLHYMINLHTTRSGRSSSEDPNIQNVPVREPRANRICRGVLYPSLGRQIMEGDFASIEVCIAAVYCKDPNLISYVTDPSTDMHGDTAKELWFLKYVNKKEPSHKHLRYSSKNGFVFPQFYGSYYANCALNMAGQVSLPQEGKWKETDGLVLPEGHHLGEHMIANNIRSYEDFVEHVKQVEDDFWNKRFKVYTEWKEKTWRKYQREGKLETYTGFSFVDVMTRNECLNRQIQCTAFHCLLWLYVKMWKQAKEEGWKTKMIGQIHDSILFDTVPQELPHIVTTMRKYVDDLPNEWTWISVPLSTEVEVSPVDRPWSEKEEWKEAA